ncbi:MAG: peptide ABC transporter substrate-binding protein [Myxococcales bacterium]|nr:MAG: peptide ABC transporter substrate-binding protein [Myxococcales bacterium]
MRTKWLLIALPLAILAFLLQSALWVPTFASQAQGNPGRLETFIQASIGEVKHLNPAVSSDFTANRFMDDNLFEGLVALDENLELKGKLAQRWEQTEVAYVAVLPERALPGGERPTPGLVLDRLKAAWQRGDLGELGGSIQSVSLVPAEARAESVTVLTKNAKGRDEPLDVPVTVQVPERVRIELSRIEPKLFEGLAQVLGPHYFDAIASDERFVIQKPEYRALVRPKLSELWQVGEHNPVITFYLQPGVRWHDGAPFTAEDVKFNYQAIVDPKNASPRAGAFDSVKSVEPIGELTAKVTYKRLYSPAILDWTQTLVPKHALDAAGLEREKQRRQLSERDRSQLSLRTTQFNRNPIGTGPFKFVKWLPNQYIHVTRNDAYWGDKARYRDFYLRSIPDYLTTELEFGAGAVDMYDALPHQAERYRKDPRYQVLSGNDGAFSFIGYNLRRPIFQDVRVRRALGMALDVEAVIKYVLSGEGKRATGPYYSITPYNDPTVQPLPYDVKGAAELLGQAGWKKNARGVLEKDGKTLSFTLVTNAGNPQRKAIMTVAQDAWTKLGVDVKIQDFEWTVFLEDFIQTNNFDALVMGWGGGSSNPDIHAIWHSSQTHPYEHNYVGYESAEADELIEKIRTTYDPKETVELAHRLHRVIAADQPYTFLYEPLKPYVFDKRITIEKADGSQQKLSTPASGDVFQFFRSWRKQVRQEPVRQ